MQAPYLHGSIYEDPSCNFIKRCTSTSGFKPHSFFIPRTNADPSGAVELIVNASNPSA